MKPVHSLRSNVTYLKQLAGAGFGGISAARQEVDCRMLTGPFHTIVWTPAVVAAVISALSTRFLGKDRRASRVAIGGLAGGIFGIGAGLAWASRNFAAPASRVALRRVNAARDARWLETHPINYA